jgi:dipeptidyl aminopeptidase/acylaminoacyl peptidase
LFVPENIKESKKKSPVIILIHGGPESQYKPYFNPITQFLVHKGYAVAAPNVRGSSGYGKEYMTLDDQEKRLDSVEDIVFLKKYLETRDGIDAEKVIVMGGSYGGYMVLANMAFYPEHWLAGVDIVGMSNLVSFLENTSEWRRALREAEYGSLEHDREMLEKVSPINKVENIQAPLFIIHGANDPRVPLSEAEQMESKLQELGREVELLVYEDEGHGLSKLENKIDAYSKMVNFLDRQISKN